MFQRLTSKYRYSIILLRELVRTDFKLRYQASILGYIWSLLRPLLLFFILYIVFAKILKVGDQIPHYPVYLLLGIVLWNFFIEITTGSINSIVGKADLIRKINFPRYIIVLALSLAAVINLLLNFVVIAIFMYFEHVTFSWSILLDFPLIFEYYLVSLGVAFFLSAAFVKLRDISYIWEVLTQAAFYAIPIVYTLSAIPKSFAKILILNPLAQIIQDIRYVTITNQTETIAQVYGGDKWIWLIPISLVIIIFTLASIFFHHQSPKFAEES